MDKVQELMRSGRPKEAEAMIDEVLALVRTPPGGTPEPKPAPADARAEPPYITKPRPVELGRIPDDAAVVYHTRVGSEDEIYVMNREGGNATRITFNNPQRYEHAAVSHDRTKIAANRWELDPSGNPVRSALWVMDLEQRTESQLLPQFYTVGEGGVDWDGDGFIYFAAHEQKRGTPGARQQVYKMRYDGTGLTQLTSSGILGAVDVGLSADGSTVAYIGLALSDAIGSDLPVSRVWLMDIDGKNQRMIFDPSRDPVIFQNKTTGARELVNAHDPTCSPDKTQVVFSRVNPRFANFANIPGLNTAHDLYIINVDGSGLRRLTPEGPISIVPDWQGNTIVYTELDEKDHYMGISLINADGTGKRRLGPGAMPKWVPPVGSRQ